MRNIRFSIIARNKKKQKKKQIKEYDLPGIIITVTFFVIYLIIVILIFSSVNQVFNTALFIYADTGEVPGQYTQTIMDNAFKYKEPKKTIINDRI